MILRQRSWLRWVLIGHVIGYWVTTAAQEQPQVIRSETVAVVVDAVVRDQRGRLLQCLTKSDFSLTEDGSRQEIVGFQPVGSVECSGLPPTPNAQGQLGLATSTPPPITAIVFEELGPEARGAAFRSAQVFIRERRRPGEFVAIFALDFALHSITPYTRDPDALLEGVRRAAMRPGCPETTAGAIANADAGTSCQGGGTGDVKVKATIAGVQEVVRTLAPFPGRKNVLIFSEGFRVSTAESAIERLEALITTANQYGVTLHTIDAVGLRTADGRQSTRQRLSSYIGSDTSGRGLVTSSEDPNALLASDPTVALARLAHGTGGEFVENTNALDNAVRRLTDEMGSYYQLSYRPTSQSQDGRYRRIALSVSVPGAVVRTRSGYFANSDRKRDVPVVTTADSAPHLILDSGATLREFDMVTTIRHTDRGVEVAVTLPATGLTFREAEGRFEAGVTILIRVLARDKKLLTGTSETLGLNGLIEGVAAARARSLALTRTLPVNGADRIEIIAYDVLGRKASVERYPLRKGRL
jgi:VWFA-related protein